MTLTDRHCREAARVVVGGRVFAGAHTYGKYL